MVKSKMNVFALIIFFLGAMFFFGCQEEQSVLTPENNLTGLSKYALPSNATLVSATLNIYINHPNSQEVNLHRITSPWLESTVTWDNFGAAYDPTPQLINYTADAVGYKAVDVTPLVQSWVNGTYTDYGILLDQAVLNSAYANYHSSENSNPPYLRIYYSTSDGTTYVDVPAVEDAYIWELEAQIPHNTPYLYTGWFQNYEKQSLLRFDIEPTPEVSCETAYAFDGDDLTTTTGTCFIDLGFGNWGWSIKLDVPGTYTFPVYAGAGQCDISKGTYVGDVTATFSGGTVSFSYDFEDGFSASETHFYAGLTPTPRDRNGNPTIAPGQYKIGTGLGNGPIYIIAHAVVCSDNWE